MLGGLADGFDGGLLPAAEGGEELPSLEEPLLNRAPNHDVRCDGSCTGDGGLWMCGCHGENTLVQE